MAERPTVNIPEYSVSELAGAVKRVIEDGFGLVRVRGELGRVSRPGSGHLYVDLKDEKAVLASVIWRGTAERLAVRPEEGMEVIAVGRMTTFAGQSRYQLVIESLEPAGVGALMALLEQRKKKLADEGLFDPARKKPLPYLPEIIGVVTSPSGAVIRDILHRLRDRFPRRVLVWPTLVQGKGAEAQIAAAIEGFNALDPAGDPPRPDLLIVARGGGSLEDLWCFNEEIVVRAAAASRIPLISAVGHETDTTLIDFAADWRAPTPTAAAEKATPVRSELIAELLNKQRRLIEAEARLLETRGRSLLAAARGLGRPEDAIGALAQRFDRAADRLGAALKLKAAAARERLSRLAPRLGGPLLLQKTAAGAASLVRLGDRLQGAAGRFEQRPRQRLTSASALLETLSYQRTLARGFALVRTGEGGVLRRAIDRPDGGAITLVFADGERAADLAPRGGRSAAGKRKSPGQGSLFD